MVYFSSYSVTFLLLSFSYQAAASPRSNQKPCSGLDSSSNKGVASCCSPGHTCYQNGICGFAVGKYKGHECPNTFLFQHSRVNSEFSTDIG
ncbi:hypothetical protein EJ08DRAFT_735716 [Tothia fuscella]|uniref:Uncharacterized protein n=1 Tax=Tothia fuscella TaxID=1048955 RepID=A0A9P4NN40_9PEZI|nr:hypothetical protein EJ08DRAFT_735716 [Tothia fuscella]